MKTLFPPAALRAAALAAALYAVTSGSAHAQLLAVDPASVNGSHESFSSLAVSDPLGSRIDGLLALPGVQFGKLFAGQELALAKAPRLGDPLAQDWFDDLAFGLPLAGLQLLAGPAGGNLGAYDYADADGVALAGIGPQHPDGSDAFGFGAISARFAQPVSALAFQVREADGGDGWLALYRADGSLIATQALGPLANGVLAFARGGGQADIAGFSLYHRDGYYGIAIDNLVFGAVAAVPEPTPALLLVAGLAALAWRRRGTHR